MEVTTDVVVFLVVTTVVYAASLFGAVALRRDLEAGMLARADAGRHLAETRLARLLAPVGWDTWRYAQAASPAAVMHQARQCRSCTRGKECDEALMCANAGAVIAFCPNAKAVRPLIEATSAAAP